MQLPTPRKFYTINNSPSTAKKPGFLFPKNWDSALIKEGVLNSAFMERDVRFSMGTERMYTTATVDFIIFNTVKRWGIITDEGDVVNAQISVDGVKLYVPPQNAIGKLQSRIEHYGCVVLSDGSLKVGVLTAKGKGQTQNLEKVQYSHIYGKVDLGINADAVTVHHLYISESPRAVLSASRGESSDIYDILETPFSEASIFKGDIESLERVRGFMNGYITELTINSDISKLGDYSELEDSKQDRVLLQSGNKTSRLHQTTY